MRRALVALAFAGVLSAQTPPANPGFEGGEPGAVPPGWLVPPAVAREGFGAKTVSEGCKSGARCAMITGVPNAPANSFGNLMQVVPAASYHMRRVRLSAAIRVEGPMTRAQMWLRLDRADGTMAFLDNMQSRPIMLGEWKTYEIEGSVARDINNIVFGVMLFGPGRAWVDDVALAPIGEVREEKIEASRPLTAQGLTNLVAFAKLYGYVRHFHPSDEAARADWDTVAIEGVRRVEGAADPAELVARLRDVFRPVAPAVAIFATGDRPPAAVTAESCLRYQHVGVGLGSGIYRSERVSAGPAKPFEAELAPGVMASIPLTVAVDKDGTLPHAAPAASPAFYVRTGDDRATRLGDIIIAWNVFQHFYPYFDVVKTDWAAELPKALRSAATDAGGAAFTATLKRLIAALHDGHGNVIGGPRSQHYLTPAVRIAWIGDELLVVRSKAEGAAPGDRVVAIDGKPVAEAAAEGRALVSAASEGYARVRLASDLTWCDGAVKRFELEPFAAPGTKKAVELPCAPPKNKDPEMYPEPRPTDVVAELEPGIVYVDLDRATDQEFRDALPRLEAAKGIIFDMRGYPGAPGIAALAHLTETPLRSARWTIPTPKLPDRLDTPFTESGWPVPPQKPYLTAKRAFLTDGRAISYAETVMGIVGHFKLGEIVGEPTAGTNGNVNPMPLPGGYTVYWTGMRVLKHDGSQHHGIGIRPTVPVSRTRRGIAEGRDELLLKAIEVVKR